MPQETKGPRLDDQNAGLMPGCIITWATSRDVSASRAHFVHSLSIAHFRRVNTASFDIRYRQGRVPQETKGPRLDDRKWVALQYLRRATLQSADCIA